MKMNLSVVMGMVDKLSAPLKGVTSESDHYAKAIHAIQEKQKDTSASLSMIDSFHGTRSAMTKNSFAIATANEKLNELREKATAAGKPNAALTEKIAKQQQRLALLNDDQDNYRNKLVLLGRDLKKAGVRMHDLDGESQKLRNRYTQHSAEITKLSKKYGILQRAMSPVQKLNKAIRLPSLSAGVLGKGSALLGGLSLAGLVGQVNSAASEMDNLAKKAGNLRLPISELQALQSQAGHAGVDAEALNGSMSRFSRQLGTLQETGKGSLATYLKNTRNPLYRELKSATDTQEAYGLLLESFSKLKTAQEQSAFANAAFGKSGGDMLIMLREGTQGLIAAREDYAALGGGASAEDAAKAEAYNDALQRIMESVKSMKFAALAPIMEKATHLFDAFSAKFKNAQWRTELIEKIIQTVEGFYNALLVLGRGLLWVSQNFKGILATLAVLKVALIGLNAVIMANPIGLMVAAIGAAIIAVVYLVDKFIGLDTVIRWISDGIGWLWEAIKSLINKLPSALVPDSWKSGLEESASEVDNLADKLNRIKDRNAKLGITENTTRNELSGTSPSVSHSALNQSAAATQYQPLTSQTLTSKSEVALTIKSAAPVTVDKAKSDKKTELDVDVGNLNWSY
ncbi:hypothetical protein [Vibrio furnissii]|uniref:hypothetical protein n=1 Tax=Vibrio furnissii TaxID=29494 RepID=UPI001559C2C8|nr:hypothetical protein [Vibrio furnissii]